jgi:hypothetical protein
MAALTACATDQIQPSMVESGIVPPRLNCGISAHTASSVDQVVPNRTVNDMLADVSPSPF